MKKKPFGDVSIVFLVCTGVGHINRGYETFTVECFNELKNSQQFEMFLLKGGGRSIDKEIKISCIRRKSRLARFIYKLTGKETYWIEQCTFLFGMLPYVIKYKPNLIYYSDFILGTFLWHIRRLFKFRYKLLFSNGAPNGPPFKTEDHVQQLLWYYQKKAIGAGAAAEKQTVLPYGFNIADTSAILSVEEIDSIRKSLSLPTNKKIIISVGAINSNHKRMDYVIREFAILNSDKYYLVLLGNIDDNSLPIFKIASDLLLPNTYTIKEVNPSDVVKYLSVSDYFLLASLNEGFGRVLIEAQQFGLLPIVHDYPVAKEVLKDYGIYADLTQSKILMNLIKKVDTSGIAREDVWRYAFNNYSWCKLKDQYSKMILNNIL